MTSHRAVVLAALAGCYAPRPEAGIACSDTQQCPSGQTCDLGAPGGPTCLTRPGTSGPADDPGSSSPDAPPPIGGAANDLPGAAIDVAPGGAFAFDLAGAHDDTSVPCAKDGADVFYRIALAAPEVIYLDTFGSAANVAVAVRDGACVEDGKAEACVDHSCGTAQAQGAWSLGAGEHCIVVEQVDTTAGTTGTLTVVRGGRTGDRLPGRAGTVTGDTCKDDNSNSAACGCEPAEDHHYFFTVCPGATGSVHLETCNRAEWDTVLQLRSSANVSLACNDDACDDDNSSLTRAVTAPGLYWAIIDGCTDCGVYTMTFALPTDPIP